MKIFASIMISSILLTSLSARTFQIGPGKTYEKIGDAPLLSLAAGDSVNIYCKNQPYYEKWVITAQGTDAKPVVFHGVADANGRLPIIDGQNAQTPGGMNFWSETRGVIKVGGSNTPSDSMPSYIIIENLEIRNGSQPYTFTGRNGITAYDANASAIFLEKGQYITIRNCVLHDCGNGFFSAHQSSNVIVEYCYIYGNGNRGSIYEHNNYTESKGITFQFNHFGPLRDGASGNNLKDRSSGTVIRYNWIESGNRQLDLVDSDYDDFISSSLYNSTYVYGNILIEPEGAGNSQIIHYGGDSGDETKYRKGTLFLYNNTIVSTRTGNTTLLRLSSVKESADVRNNIIFVSATGSRLGIVDDVGSVALQNNWFKTGWKISHSNPSAAVIAGGKNQEGVFPAFTDTGKQDFTLKQGSACINGTTTLAEACKNSYTVDHQYSKHQNGTIRSINGLLDIGAFEYQSLSYTLWKDKPSNIPTSHSFIPRIKFKGLHQDVSARGAFTLNGSRLYKPEKILVTGTQFILEER